MPVVEQPIINASLAEKISEPAIPATLQEKIQRAVATAEKIEAEAEGKSATRDASGKFLPKSGPETEPEAGGEDEAPKEETPATETVKGDFKQALKLMRDGDVYAAVEAALPGAIEKLEKIDHKQWKAFRHETAKVKQQTNQALEASNRRLSEAHQVATEAYREVAPLMEARQAFAAGDYSTAFERAFGVDINDFQRNILRQKHGETPGEGKLRQELDELKRSLQARDERERQQQNQMQAERQQQAYVEHVKSELADLDVPQAALKNQHFLRDVLTELRDAYDSRTNTTIPIEEAVDTVLDRDDWSFMRDPGAKTPVNKRDQASPAKPATKPRLRSLTQRNAAEAVAPGPPKRGAELLQHFIQLHRAGGVVR